MLCVGYSISQVYLLGGSVRQPDACNCCAAVAENCSSWTVVHRDDGRELPVAAVPRRLAHPERTGMPE